MLARKQGNKETRKQPRSGSGGHISHLKNKSVKLVGNGIVVNEEEKRRIIDLHFNQGKTIREVSRIMGKSSHDITPVKKEHRIQLVQKYALTNGEHSGVVQREQDRVISNVKAYNLFDEGKSPLEVAAD
jgi:hypothetical protein